MIDFSFSTEQENLKKDIEQLANAFLNVGVIERDKSQKFDHQLWSEAGRLTLQGLPVAEKYGGKGLDVISTIHALESLGYACKDNGLSFAIGAHLLASVVPIYLYGTEAQKLEYLPNLCNGTWVAANAMTELSSGSDAFNMDGSARLENEQYLLNAEKNYCSNAPVADYILTYVMTNKQKGAMGGVSAFILPKDKVAIGEVVDKMGLRSCLMADVSVKNIKVDQGQLLGKEGGGLLIFSQSMIWERIGLSAMHLGTLKRLIEQATSYVKQRKIAGKPIGGFQSIAHQLANINTDLNAARWLTYYAAWCLQNKKESNLYASMSKLKASEVYKKSCQSLIQIMGAKAYVDNHDFERNLRDATACTLYSGTSEIQRNIIAGWMNL